MLPFFEQGAMYNAANFNLCSSDVNSLTICGVRIASLICPSNIQNDTIPIPSSRASSAGVSPGWSFNLIPSGTADAVFPLPPGNWLQAFTSYAGNAGTFTFGYSNLMTTSILGFFNGVICNDSSVKIAGITDGTSNTFLFGEHSKGLLYKLDPSYAVSDTSWNSGRWYDTLFATLYPLNTGNGNNIGVAAPPLTATTITPWRVAFTLAARTSRSVTARSGSSRTRSTTGHSTRAMPTATAMPCPTTRPT